MELRLSYLRTIHWPWPLTSLYLRDSAMWLADNPLTATFSTTTKTNPSGNPNLLWISWVTSRIRWPSLPTTLYFLVAEMMTQIIVGDTWTSNPEYPSSANSRENNLLSSALKTPSATNWNRNQIGIVLKESTIPQNASFNRFYRNW